MIETLYFIGWATHLIPAVAVGGLILYILDRLEA